MMKAQFEALSASLSRAIRPFARKIEVTAIPPNHVEPLRVLRKGTQSDLPSAHPHDSEKLDAGVSQYRIQFDTGF